MLCYSEDYLFICILYQITNAISSIVEYATINYLSKVCYFFRNPENNYDVLSNVKILQIFFLTFFESNFICKQLKTVGDKPLLKSK